MYFLWPMLIGMLVSYSNAAPKPQALEEFLRNERQICLCTCGLINREQRIVGGKATVVNAYPWLVALHFRKKFYCGGTLINDQYVMTAAHCVDGLPYQNIILVLGEHDQNTTTDSQSLERNIAEVVRHPHFSRRTFNNDIALLRLDQHVPFSQEISPACLPTQDRNFVGEQATVAGWGRTSEKGSPSNILREVTVPIFDNDKCVQQTNYTKKEITEFMMCAGYADGQKDACQGDSGGPLHWENEQHRKEVIGIVSWGQGCARAGYPGVYTRITRYLQWIRQNTKDACYCGNSSEEESEEEEEDDDEEDEIEDDEDDDFIKRFSLFD